MATRADAHQELNAFRRKQDSALVIKGDSMEVRLMMFSNLGNFVLISFLLPQVCLDYYEHEFMELVTACPAVVCCRCSPEQKAQVVRLIQRHTGKRTAAIGED